VPAAAKVPIELPSTSYSRISKLTCSDWREETDMSKAIIEITRPGAYLAAARTAARRVDAGGRLPEADYHLGFETATQLFAELTPARMALLEALQQTGPTSIYALAKQLGRNYSNVHSDVSRLIEHDLIHKGAGGKVFVPWEQIQIRVTLGAERAA
jgi:predicted transcriptional regulator